MHGKERVPLGFDLVSFWGFFVNCIQDRWKKVKFVNNVAIKFYTSGTLTLFEQRVSYNVGIKPLQNCQANIASPTSNLLKTKVIIFLVSFASKDKTV